MVEMRQTQRRIIMRVRKIKKIWIVYAMEVQEGAHFHQQSALKPHNCDH